MTARRDAILRGVARAAEVHRDLGLREALKEGDRPVDVLAVIQELGLFLLFKPLDGLLGAYMPSTVSPGVLITTRRNLHIQRFTAAHELGHHLLAHHALSLDKEEDVGFIARGDVTGHNLQEVEADAFASEFLLPKWLVVAQARRHKWGRRELAHPDIAYQLSLRLGASYSATCWALVEGGIVDPAHANTLFAATPKDSKQRAMPDITPETWHPDVWVLSEHDHGGRVLGNPDDHLVLDLRENIAGGYAWDTAGIHAMGLSVDRDHRASIADDTNLGAPVTRRLIVHGPAKGTLKLKERRTWEADGVCVNTYEVALELSGAEPEGLPRAAKALAA